MLKKEVSEVVQHGGSKHGSIPLLHKANIFHDRIKFERFFNKFHFFGSPSGISYYRRK